MLYHAVYRFDVAQGQEVGSLGSLYNFRVALMSSVHVHDRYDDDGNDAFLQF